MMNETLNKNPEAVRERVTTIANNTNYPEINNAIRWNPTTKQWNVLNPQILEQVAMEDENSQKLFPFLSPAK